jgi:hypothetical protein
VTATTEAVQRWIARMGRTFHCGQAPPLRGLAHRKAHPAASTRQGTMNSRSRQRAPGTSSAMAMIAARRAAVRSTAPGWAEVGTSVPLSEGG